MITRQDFYSKKVFPDQQLFPQSWLQCYKTKQAQIPVPKTLHTISLFKGELGGLLAVNCFEGKKKKVHAKYCCLHESTHTLQNSLLTIYTMIEIAILRNKLDALQSVAQEQQATPSVTVSDNSALQANMF